MKSIWYFFVWWVRTGLTLDNLIRFFYHLGCFKSLLGSVLLIFILPTKFSILFKSSKLVYIGLTKIFEIFCNCGLYLVFLSFFLDYILPILFLN